MSSPEELVPKFKLERLLNQGENPSSKPNSSNFSTTA